jgi:hypothetical protein
MKYEIKSLDIKKVAAISGVLHFCLTALLCIPMGIFMNLNGAFPVSSLFMKLFIFLMPFIYGILGILIGALVAFVYNVLASKMGGLVVDLKKAK